MQTFFSAEQRQDPLIQRLDKEFRSCVHCGLCTAACPTYLLLKDEADSPRGRIYQMKTQLEQNGPVTAEYVTHVDRCLSCLACTSVCPTGLDYAQLIDEGRALVEEQHKRPLANRLLRAVLAALIPYPARFRWALRLGSWFSWLTPRALLTKLGSSGKSLAAMLALVPSRLPSQKAFLAPGHYPQKSSAKQEKARVAFLLGCAQSVLAPEINQASQRLLRRLGVSLFVPEALCCGSLVQHMGKKASAIEQAKKQIMQIETLEQLHGPMDKVLLAASGCGASVKHYGKLFAGESENWRKRAARLAAKTADILEYIHNEKLLPQNLPSQNCLVAWQAPCSMQHGQKLKEEPQALLRQAGFTLVEPRESTLCCGSAGVYNIMQPDIASSLKKRKVAHLQELSPDVVASANIGCLTQLEGDLGLPICHAVQLLDRALAS